MSKERRKLLTLKCPDCSHEFTSPMNLLFLPDDLGFLAECLGLPPATVTAMLDRGEIPIRHNVDKNGRPTGRRAVLLGDVHRAMKGLREYIS
jgi:hypothetical protein